MSKDERCRHGSRAGNRRAFPALPCVVGGFPMSELAGKHCVPCRGGVAPLKGAELAALAAQTPDWKVVNEHHLEKTFTFPDFAKALEYVNKVGAMAEAEGHHPDLL